MMTSHGYIFHYPLFSPLSETLLSGLYYNSVCYKSGCIEGNTVVYRSPTR